MYFYPTIKNLNELIVQNVPELKDLEWTPEWAKEYFSKHQKEFINVANFSKPVH